MIPHLITDKQIKLLVIAEHRIAEGLSPDERGEQQQPEQNQPIRPSPVARQRFCQVVTEETAKFHTEPTTEPAMTATSVL